MEVKLFFKIAFLSFILIVIVKSQELNVRQHGTYDSFKQLKISFQNSKSIIAGDIDNLENFDYPNFLKNNFVINNKFAYYLKILETNNQQGANNIKDKCLYYGKQFILGELSGLGCSLLSAVIAGPFYPKNKDGVIGAGYVASAMYIGYTIGNSIGVYCFGKTQYNSSYIKTFIGSMLGASIGLYIYDLCGAKGPLCSTLVLGPTIGSILGFNLSRKPTELPTNALINYNNGGLSSSLNNVFIYYDSSNNLSLNIKLLQVNF